MARGEEEEEEDRVPGGEKPRTDGARAEGCVRPGPSDGLPRLSPSFSPNGGAVGTQASGRVRFPARPAETHKPWAQPSRTTCCRGRTRRSIYSQGASPHGQARAWRGGGRGGKGPRGPAPFYAAPPPALPSTLGAPGPPLRPWSAARCRVWGLAEGRASLRKATSRPFLQCE